MLQLKEICPLQMNTHATIIIQLCYILETIKTPSHQVFLRFMW